VILGIYILPFPPLYWEQGIWSMETIPIILTIIAVQILVAAVMFIAV